MEKSSAKEIAAASYAAGRERGRYLFQFTVRFERYWTTLDDPYALFDRIEEKIRYYLESFRFVHEVTDILFYEFQDNMDFSREGYTNVTLAHPDLYVL